MYQQGTILPMLTSDWLPLTSGTIIWQAKLTTCWDSIFRTYDCEVDESFWITKEYFDLATEYFKEQQKGSESEFSSESDSDSQ